MAGLLIIWSFLITFSLKKYFDLWSISHWIAKNNPRENNNIIESTEQTISALICIVFPFVYLYFLQMTPLWTRLVGFFFTKLGKIYSPPKKNGKGCTPHPCRHDIPVLFHLPLGNDELFFPCSTTCGWPQSVYPLPPWRTTTQNLHLWRMTSYISHYPLKQTNWASLTFPP